MDNTSYKQLVNSMVDFCKSNSINIEETPPLIERFKLDVLNSLVENSEELYVLKKKGQVEKFDEEKLFLSVGNASDEIEEPLTSGDIHNIVSDVVQTLNDKNNKLITSFDIKDAVMDILNELGFFEVHNSYKDYVNGR